MLPSGCDRAFIQDLVYTAIRRIRPLRSVLGKLVSRWPKGELESLLYVGAAQILYMPEVPDFAAVNETVAAAKECENRSIAKVVNAVLRNLIRRREEFTEYLASASLAERETSAVSTSSMASLSSSSMTSASPEVVSYMARAA